MKQPAEYRYLNQS
jgi:myosin-5